MPNNISDYLLKNSESNCQCFIVGTGSSINQQDLTLLKDKVVIGISNLFLHPDFPSFHPKYYVLTRVFQHLNRSASENELISLLRDADNSLNDRTILFLDLKDKVYIKKYKLFIKKKIIWLNYLNWDFKNIKDINIDSFPGLVCSVSEAAIQVALYLGFTNIYLVGFDHNWYTGKFSYFDTKKVRSYFKMTKKQLVNKVGMDSERLMAQHSRMFSKYKALYQFKNNIYNANADPDSYVDVFPKVKYEELFNKKISLKINKAQKEHNIVESNAKAYLRGTCIEIMKGEVKKEFYSQFSHIFNEIIKLRINNKKYLIYGYGSLGRMIESFIPENIIGFIDSNSNNIDRNNVYAPSELSSIKYDKIIFSLIGRNDILNSLIKTFMIKENTVIDLSDYI